MGIVICSGVKGKFVYERVELSRLCAEAISENDPGCDAETKSRGYTRVSYIDELMVCIHMVLVFDEARRCPGPGKRHQHGVGRGGTHALSGISCTRDPCEKAKSGVWNLDSGEVVTAAFVPVSA